MNDRPALGRIVLNRPEAGNAIDPALIADFAAAVEAASAASIRALLIMARGGNFSLGGDVEARESRVASKRGTEVISGERFELTPAT